MPKQKIYILFLVSPSASPKTTTPEGIFDIIWNAWQETVAAADLSTEI